VLLLKIKKVERENENLPRAFNAIGASASGTSKCLYLITNSQSANEQYSDDPLYAYKKFAWFAARSINPFINYHNVLRAGMAWEIGDYGELSRDE